MIEQFRTLLHSRPFDPAELNADDQIGDSPAEARPAECGTVYEIQ